MGVHVHVRQALVSLDLYHNDIGPIGGTELSSALRRNSTLISLNMDWNNIGDEGAAHFLATLQGFNTSLTSLSLGNNHVMPPTMRSIEALLVRNTSKKVEEEWQGINRQLVPLRYELGDFTAKRAFFDELPDNDADHVAAQRDFYTEKIEVPSPVPHRSPLVCLRACAHEDAVVCVCVCVRACVCS